MGILGLSKLIADVAPAAIKENEIKNYFGRLVSSTLSYSTLLQRLSLGVFIFINFLYFLYFVDDDPFN